VRELLAWALLFSIVLAAVGLSFVVDAAALTLALIILV
jgi:hypothetical protein